MIDNNNNHKSKDEELNKIKQFQTFIDDNLEYDFYKDMDIDKLANTINDDKLIKEDIKRIIELSESSFCKDWINEKEDEIWKDL